MQTFKNRFGIRLDGSWQEGIRDLETSQRDHPGYLVSFGTNPADDAYFYMVAPAQTRNVDTPETLAVFMRFMFYISQAGQSSIASMRAGSVGLADISGMAALFAPN